MSCCPTPLTPELRRLLGLPLLSFEIPWDALPADSAWGREMRLDGARYDLAEARASLAAAVRAQDPNRHFRGLPECPRVIAACDAVRAAKATAAKLDRDGRRS